MTRDLRAQIGTAVGCDLVPLTHDQKHNNTHFRGDRDGVPTLFIKVTDSPRSYTTEVGAHTLLHTRDLPTPTLHAHGDLGLNRHWLAYAWHDFTPFAATPESVEEAGRLLGRLHTATRGESSPHLRTHDAIPNLIDAKIALVAEFDAPLARRIRALRDKLLSTPAAAHLGDERCLLHGDMGWRNLHLDADGSLWIFDFEHAAIGHPLLDFAKLWDRELDSPQVRSLFLDGYRKEQREVPIDTAAIGAVRLWAAAGIFPYARPRDDQDFEQHAYLILERLEREVSGRP
ncbi:phosphotransferase enzyme family protein [Streptomyces sp. NPDC102360]|uniref:phosphotransferase enzyme family protein n=1 Tax=Streptomyces sp. NPDC102360 TaxID=3366160 RepID=UPI0037F8684F